MGKKTSSSSKGAAASGAEDELTKCLVGVASKFLNIIPAADRKSFNRIGFHVEAAWWFYTDYCRPVTRSLPNLNFRAFAPLLLSKQPDLLAPFGGLGALPRLLDAFFNYRSQIPVCGAAIFDTKRKRVLLVRGLHSASKWSFPRGKMNAHESAAACAIREVWEEVGYDIGPLLKEELKLEWIRRGQHPIRIYVVTLPEGHEEWPFEPQTMGEIGEIGWHRLEALRKFRTTYFDVNQFERGLRKFAKDPQNIINAAELENEEEKEEERLVMKKVSMSELFPKKEDPFCGTTKVDDDSEGFLDPTERVLQIVDELKLTDWLPSTTTSRSEMTDEESRDLFNLLLFPAYTQTSSSESKEKEEYEYKEEDWAFPRKKTPEKKPSSGGDEHRDLISLILFGK